MTSPSEISIQEDWNLDGSSPLNFFTPKNSANLHGQGNSPNAEGIARMFLQCPSYR